MRVARKGHGVELASTSLEAMATSRAIVDRLATAPTPVYGISTGFGALATRHISPELRDALQRSLVRSHAAGTGAEVEKEVTRATQLLRLHTLATGRTGVHPDTARLSAAMLSAGITPVIHEYGSLGCSGDLAPLSHIALSLMGEGTVRDAQGTLMPAAQALEAAGLRPVTLGAKEGLALINGERRYAVAHTRLPPVADGPAVLTSPRPRHLPTPAPQSPNSCTAGTDGMLGMLCLALHDIRVLVSTADIAAAMSVEALLGTDRVFAHELQALRPHPGQAASASNMRALLKGSPIVASHADPATDSRVQDAYSLRCSPQVAGAVRDTLSHAETVASRELASAIDNPVVLPDGRVESNGNFHGAPVALVLDFLAIAIADLASISERRTDRMLDKARSHGLPPFLAHDPGVDSGLMIAQYSAAGMVSEMKRLAVPASVDSIPSSAMQEDHVSMGWGAARKLRRSVDCLTRVIAIEIMTAARALDMRTPLRAGAATGAVLARLRLDVAGPGPDRFLSPEIEATVALVASGELLAAAEGVTGPLA